MISMQSSLQRRFILPFVLLLACLAVTVGWVMYRASEDATNALAKNALVTTAVRIKQATERHLSNAHATLKTIAPDPVFSMPKGILISHPFPRNARQLQDRLWVALGLFPEINRHVYFGDRDGGLIGLQTLDGTEYYLHVNKPGSSPGSIFRVSGPNQPPSLVSKQDSDVRETSWYRRAMSYGEASWSPLQRGEKGSHGFLTLSKPVYDEKNIPMGVAATELPIDELNFLIQSVAAGGKGIAFIVDRSGELIASSMNEQAYEDKGKGLARVHAAESASPLIRQAFDVLSKTFPASLDAEGIHNYEFENDSEQIQGVASMLRDSAGLEWIVSVAVPRSEFRGSVTSGIYPSLAAGLFAMSIALLLGFFILRRALSDIRKLTFAAQSVGSGTSFQMLDIERGDEIGQLAQSFRQMESSLRTDKLTRVLNRDSLITQIDFRCRSASDINPLYFSILFIDLDGFKLINDRYGHDEGDRVLIEIAARLQGAVRKDDAVARFGGDEFVVYLHGVRDEVILNAVCEKIRLALEAPIVLRDGTMVEVGASIGAASYPADGKDSDSFFRLADNRMFNAKKSRKKFLQLPFKPMPE